MVDEFHLLPQVYKDRITAAAADFSSVLVLTATPNLQDLREHLQLLRILEPDRLRHALLSQQPSEAHLTAALADLKPSTNETDLSAIHSSLLQRDREAAAQHTDLSASGWRTEWGPQPDPGEQTRAETAEQHCTYRNVIRSRRTELPEILPERVYECRVVEPTGAEVEREQQCGDTSRTSLISPGRSIL